MNASLPPSPRLYPIQYGTNRTMQTAQLRPVPQRKQAPALTLVEGRACSNFLTKASQPWLERVRERRKRERREEASYVRFICLQTRGFSTWSRRCDCKLPVGKLNRHHPQTSAGFDFTCHKFLALTEGAWGMSRRENHASKGRHLSQDIFPRSFEDTINALMIDETSKFGCEVMTIANS